MATIQTSIVMADNISSTLYNITYALSGTTSGFEAMQAVVDRDIDASAFDHLSESINSTTAMIDSMTTAAENIPSMDVSANFDLANAQIQAVEKSMTRITAAQNTIFQKSGNLTVITPQTILESQKLNDEIQRIGLSIRQIESNPINSVQSNTVNMQLEEMKQQLNDAYDTQQMMNAALKSMDASAANQAYNQLNATVNSTEDNIRNNVSEQGRFNQMLQRGQTAANGLLNKIMGMAAAYLSIQGAGKVLNLSDTMASNAARLDLIVDDGGSVQELQNKIFLSAQRARGDYLAVSQTVSKLGLLAGNAFSSNNEMIAFTEQMNKNFVIGGASIQEQTSAMYQLTQAMAAGKLQGDEYRSIIENAPLLAGAIEDYMLDSGVSGTMKEWAADGLLTADVIKNAMFSVADETNARFEKMPQTFAQVAVGMKNNAIMAFEPILTRLNEVANSPQFQVFADNASGALFVVADKALQLFDIIGASAGFVSENWSTIAPLIVGVVAALGVYNGAMFLYNTVQTIGNGLAAISTARAALKTGVTIAEAAATTTATGAQVGLNAALLACPLTWIVIVIMIVIAAIYGAVGAINHFKGTSISATGIIAGAFAVLGAHVINTFVVPAWNAFAAVANFFGNVFNNPVAAVKVLFYDMAQTVIGYILNMARAIENVINKIPHVTVDITSGLDSFYNNLAAASQKVKDESGWVEYVGSMEFIDYQNAAAAGYNFGQGIESKLSNIDFASRLPENNLSYDGFEMGNDYGMGGGYDPSGMARDVANIDQNTKGTMDITEENLKYWRDIAEREAINRFTTAEIRIDGITTNNTVNSKVDLDGISEYVAERIGEDLQERLFITAEGVH